ncbi:MAG TPA: hypothetical protein ENG95_04360 [Nitrospirae bacterium]|nr:hypothetical protein [Nitrospirota bacterium]
MKKLVVVLAVVFLFVGISIAGNVTLTSDEPTTNENGTDLNDLAKIQFYYRLADDVWTSCGTVPATSPQGGGSVTTPCLLPDDLQEDVDFKANACDLSGNCSVDSEIATEPIDTVSPSPPSCRLNK